MRLDYKEGGTSRVGVRTFKDVPEELRAQHSKRFFVGSENGLPWEIETKAYLCAFEAEGSAMNKKYKVLVVDDSVEDQLLTQFALKDSKCFEIVSCLNNGELALAYFKGWHRYGNRRECPLPDLLLLDLNMPCCDGFEVLRWLKAHPQPRLVKVMLTSSNSDADIARATALGAQGYIVKPASLKEIQMLEGRLLACLGAIPGTASLERRPARGRSGKSVRL
jgi:CheY-like chemotaxis protein